MKLKVSEIAKESGGRLISGDPEAVVTGFATDSREIKKGTMFVPIKGEKTDSHRFIPQVFESGAAASFSEEELEAGENAVVLVKDSRQALQKTAAYYRSSFDIPIVGVTGSAGKTTAKEMIALALSAKLNVMKTQGNANSQVGVPITICTLKKDNTAAVVEMGVSMPGEMERISAVVKATHLVVTNIGVSHIEYLKSRENIMAEKLKAADYIKDGAVFVNGDDDLLATLKESTKTRVVTFGLAPHCDWHASELRDAAGGTYFLCQHRGLSWQMFVPAAGVHNVRNALAAFAVATELGVDIEDAARAVASYKPPKMRQQIIETNGKTIIDDSYNANPDSMNLALDLLAKTEGTRKVAVLADMLELGEYSAEAHRGIGEHASELGIDYLVCIGTESRLIHEGFGNAECSSCFEDNEQATAFLDGFLQQGDVVLLKGSRGMKLDEIVKYLQG